MPITEGNNYTPHSPVVSPGVFSRESDESGIAQGVADIGAVIVAPFAKGPGFSPYTARSVAELESKFGTADGTLYGPYTAKQYLQEKGFVTVCRVGALTGYHQKYPFAIIATPYVLARATDMGWVASGSLVSSESITYTPADAQDQGSGSGGSGSFTGSIIFVNQPATLVMGADAKTANPAIENASGSVLYAGQTIVGTLSGTWSFTGSLEIDWTSPADTILQELYNQNLISGSITNASFSGAYPFDSVSFEDVGVVQTTEDCGPVLNLHGLISGSIGALAGGGVANGSASVLAVLADTQNATINSLLEAPGFNGSTLAYSGSQASGSMNFVLTLSSSLNTGYGKYSFSLDPNAQTYITNVFGNKATAGKPPYDGVSKREAAYLYKVFEDTIAKVAASPQEWVITGTVLPSGSYTGEAMKWKDAYSLDLLNGDSAYGLTNAYTPFVVSQKVAPWNGGESTRFPLFRFLTLSDGTYTNTSYKIEISNVKLAGTVAGSDWGTFNVTVRDYSDTDKRPKVLDSFPNCNLDPTSPDFIARRIGDRYNYIRFDGKIIEFGTYTNNSQYIRVEMTPNPYPVTSVPYGFQAYTSPIGGMIDSTITPIAYNKASTYGLFPGKYPSGVDFSGVPAGADAALTILYPTSSVGIGKADDNLQYFAPVPARSTIGANTVFALDDETTLNGVGKSTYLSGNAVPATYDAAKESTYVKMRKFIFGFQGGFDGQSPAIPLNLGGDITAGNTQGLNCANSTTAGSVAYNQCIGALSNADEFDINLISTPGIIYSQHSYVTTLVVEMCEKRGDCFYILDMYKDDGNPTSGQIPEVISLAGEFDTSYAGTYYPWVKIKDTNTNQIVVVPPSVVMPGVYAANDKVAGEWWAIAGLNRGGITVATQVTDRTTHTERDDLYEGRINPIVAFPGQGIVAWGQKTLQVKASALDRINVRRVLIEIKKFFAATSRYLVFEQNTAQTRNKFLAIVNPYLESIQQRSGLYAFQVVMDETNNSADLIDRNILTGNIYLKPTKTAEFILLSFDILPTGASFPNA